MQHPKTVQRYRDEVQPGRPTVGFSRTIMLGDDIISKSSEVSPSIIYRRSDCIDGPRPCPHVGCPANNYLTITSKGNLKLTHGNREPEDVPPGDSCCLDVTDQGPQTLERVAEIMGLTRERIRQIERTALEKIKSHVGEETIRSWIEKLPSP
jgi:hypothetical protein